MSDTKELRSMKYMEWDSFICESIEKWEPVEIDIFDLELVDNVCLL